MTATPATFRSDFPEFTNTVTYTDSQITFWLGVAYKMLNALAWGELLDLGAELFCAHNMVLEQWNAKTASFGGAPGGRIGAVSNKSVDKVSVGYDVSSAIMPDATHWNMTDYGVRYSYFVRTFGIGPLQIYC